MKALGCAPADLVKRVVAWMLTGVVVLSGYAFAKLDPFAVPVELPLSSIDHAIPFVPWTVWLYGTVTWASLLAWLQVPDRRAAERLFFTLVSSAVVCWIFFLVWPTTYPRHLFPLPELDTATVREFTDLRTSDSPSNCFPSMHVALAWGLALTWAGFLERRWARPLPIVWATVVTTCTLTTKQHYAVDLPPGILIGVASWWSIRRLSDRARGWHRPGQHAQPSLHLAREEDAHAVAKLRAKVEAHQWSLDTIDWPEGPLPPLDPSLVRLLNEITYIEEIAGLNFQLLRDAARDEDLRVLYGFFADEERRHADGLRKLLRLHRAPLRSPGLGNTLVLDQFDSLDPLSPADAVLVAMANPVFETFLDAGTIPFLRSHPALQSPAFDEFVKRVCRDEAAHMTLNWRVTRDTARRNPGLRGLHLLANPSIYFGMLAIPFMSLDVYSLAYRVGYDFRTLLPPFGKLWTLHRRYPELARCPMWWMFRLFVVCGALATVVADGLHRMGLLVGRFWTTFTAVTDRLAWLGFGPALLRRRDLPEP